MAKAKKPTLKKPMLSASAAIDFAEGRSGSKSRSTTAAITRSAREGTSDNSRFAPTGDIRLTVNMRLDLHLKLKIEAAQRRTTIGEILEELVLAHFPE